MTPDFILQVRFVFATAETELRKAKINIATENINVSLSVRGPTFYLSTRYSKNQKLFSLGCGSVLGWNNMDTSVRALQRLVTSLTIVFAAVADARKAPLFFSDSQGVKYTFLNFNEKLENSLKSKIPEPSFIVVCTPTGQDSKYLKKNRILDELGGKFEEFATVVVIGCAKLCVINGYKIENPPLDSVSSFKLEIFGTKVGTTVSSRKVMSAKQLIQGLNEVGR